MQMIILGIFLVWHGLVHGLYAGQSRRLFELRPNMIWPDGSWLFARLLGDKTTRLLASIALALAALGFMAGGLGLFIGQEWWRPVVMVSAALSSATFILCWDGKFQALHDQGGIGVLINLALGGIVLILK
jgi:hypothetical protein